MKLVPAKTPGFVKSLFPNFIWNINTKKQELFLTFDDGPTPEITPWVLDLLKKYNAKATFFCIGSNIEKHPGIFKQILDDGHSVGNHTQNHLKGWKCKTKDYLNDVLKCEETMSKQSTSTRFDSAQRPTLSETDSSISKLFRPPYGKLKSKQGKKLQELGYKIVMWDVLSFDWDKSVSEEKCLQNVLKASNNGSIIVFHDSDKASHNLKAVLPQVLEYYNGKGCVFKSLNYFFIKKQP